MYHMYWVCIAILHAICMQQRPFTHFQFVIAWVTSTDSSYDALLAKDCMDDWQKLSLTMLAMLTLT